jgi:hypothetical protein
MLETVLFITAMAFAVVDGSTPAARWDFDGKPAVPWTVKGNVQADQAGPRPPEFPKMAKDNAAVRLDSGGYLAVHDAGPESDFDFENGDAVTLEAWVIPSVLRGGQVSYVIEKGRTGSPKFARDNQNWSMRLVGASGEAKLSFLFATKPSKGDKHWHRWDSQLGFPVGTGWHHVAIAYRFGEPKSIRGWINGEPTRGTWSYGGETNEPPVVDDDEVRIGNGFDGLLDGIAIHRGLLSDQVHRLSISSRRRTAYRQAATGGDASTGHGSRSPRAGAVVRRFAGARPLAERGRAMARRVRALDQRDIPAAADSLAVRRLGHPRRLEGSGPAATGRRC